MGYVSLPEGTNHQFCPESWICLVGDFFRGLYHGKSHVFVNHHLGEYVFYFFQPREQANLSNLKGMCHNLSKFLVQKLF